jgi:hypothetical protein
MKRSKGSKINQKQLEIFAYPAVKNVFPATGSMRRDRVLQNLGKIYSISKLI